jgi:hypothetical protein
MRSTAKSPAIAPPISERIAAIRVGETQLVEIIALSEAGKQKDPVFGEAGSILSVVAGTRIGRDRHSLIVSI